MSSIIYYGLKQVVSVDTYGTANANYADINVTLSVSDTRNNMVPPDMFCLKYHTTVVQGSKLKSSHGICFL